MRRPASPSRSSAKTLIASIDGLLFEHLASPAGLDLDPAEPRTTVLRLMRTN
ncbi:MULTISPECIES: hypothetical protein [unclassified Streptomyces]|uniref:hypothetical protein n=1 Tax=unclassified Streptomyces TaxID=2593676 RepID=UPI0035D681A5